MSSPPRWRGIGIVGPLDQKREQEIVGGLQNAINRGETIEKAKQSFLNAGYRREEIELAARKINRAESVPVSATNRPLIGQITKQPAQTIERQQMITQSQNKKSSKWVITILIIISILILVGAATLGIYWEKIFGR